MLVVVGEQTCAEGNVGGSGHCNNGWVWNTREAQGAADACRAFGTCTACTNHLNCGWCMSSNSCKSSDCRDWSARSCPSDQAAIQAADAKALKKQTYTITELGGAALFLLVPAVIAFKNRNEGISRSAKTADSAAQWDDAEGDALEFEPVNSYQSNRADDEAAEYGESSGLVDEVA